MSIIQNIKNLFKTGSNLENGLLYVSKEAMDLNEFPTISNNGCPECGGTLTKPVNEFNSKKLKKHYALMNCDFCGTIMAVNPGKEYQTTTIVKGEEEIINAVKVIINEYNSEQLLALAKVKVNLEAQLLGAQKKITDQIMTGVSQINGKVEHLENKIETQYEMIMKQLTTYVANAESAEGGQAVSIQSTVADGIIPVITQWVEDNSDKFKAKGTAMYEKGVKEFVKNLEYRLGKVLSGKIWTYDKYKLDVVGLCPGLYEHNGEKIFLYITEAGQEIPFKLSGEESTDRIEFNLFNLEPSAKVTRIRVIDQDRVRRSSNQPNLYFLNHERLRNICFNIKTTDEAGIAVLKPKLKDYSPTSGTAIIINKPWEALEKLSSIYLNGDQK